MTNFSTLFSPVSVTIANISELKADPQTLSFDENNQNLSITNGNTVSLSGLAGTGREDVNTLVIENSGNWNTAYNTATAYSSVSSSFVTNTTLESVSSLLLPTTIYQNASGNWEAVNTLVIENSSSWFNTFWQFTSSSTGYQLSAFYPKTLVSTLCSTVSITLPEIPNNGEEYTFKDCFNTWDSNNFLLSSNYPIDGFTEVLSANVQGGVFTVIFVGIDTGWTII